MNWSRLAEGIECPFDQPRVEPNEYWDAIIQLRVSTLCLLKNQAYRGHCILIYDPLHAIRPDQLTVDEWSLFSADLHTAAGALVDVLQPDHLNIECLGNVIPHLHWHIIPRYRSDARWGGPVWTTTIEEMHHHVMADDERSRLIADLRAQLAGT